MGVNLKEKPVLYVLSSPIGNLNDLSFRAVDVLKKTDIIVCEDSRVTNKILMRYSIKKPLFSYHQHTSPTAVKKIIDKIKSSSISVYLSDAGTPGIQDPGPQLIESILKSEADIDIVPVPGPSAVTTILSVAHFRVDSFVFFGFLPKKKGKEKIIKKILEYDMPVVFFESSHRVVKTLKQMVDLDEVGDRQIIIGKDLTKLKENIFRGTIKEAYEYYCEFVSVKGEFVFLLDVQK